MHNQPPLSTFWEAPGLIDKAEDGQTSYNEKPINIHNCLSLPGTPCQHNPGNGYGLPENIPS